MANDAKRSRESALPLSGGGRLDHMLSIADSLEELANNLHSANRRDSAGTLIVRLREDLTRGLEHHADVLPCGPEERGRVREMTAAVMRGLRAVARDRLPTRMTRFVLASTMLCEFIRLYAGYGRATTPRTVHPAGPAD